MDIRTLATRASSFFEGSEELREPVPGLLLIRRPAPSPLEATLYEPAICLGLQGLKETTAGARVFRVEPGESMVVSHDLPVVSRITRAGPGEPYLALVLQLDVALLRGLHDQVYDEVREVGAGDGVGEEAEAHSVAVHETDPDLVDALGRYLAVAEDPVSARVLLPLVRKEVHFRLLRAPHGGMLRRLLRHDSHASSGARAIAHIRRDYQSTIVIPDLAKEVGMSPSTLHKHFKAVTSTTPLQYQKELRLLEARRLLLAGDHSVSTAAYEVGLREPEPVQPGVLPGSSGCLLGRSWRPRPTSDRRGAVVVAAEPAGLTTSRAGWARLPQEGPGNTPQSKASELYPV